MIGWLLALLGLSGTAVAAILALAPYVPWLAPAAALIRAVASVVWSFVRQPPGLYVALVAAAILAGWLWGVHQRNLGKADQAEADQRTIITLEGSVGRLQAGINACNVSVDAAHAAGVKQGAEAQKAADARQAGVDAAQREAGRILAIKPGANALVTAQSVALTGREP